eukprot:TRINITY_DN59829_c0_g1_i1.p1 TRINITY_DN59829_c0_g1~~TRINITY_DN59829_c0_g1_i1.p1  ORF type:complete len:111 (+),score=17.48 TRINITY_DN59829_c0_g1_i1:220-552(+)
MMDGSHFDSSNIYDHEHNDCYFAVLPTTTIATITFRERQRRSCKLLRRSATVLNQAWSSQQAGPKAGNSSPFSLQPACKLHGKPSATNSEFSCDRHFTGRAQRVLCAHKT